MSQPISEHDVVALLNDLPEEGLLAGDTGTAVHVYQGGRAFEVEFANPTGKPRYRVVTVPAEQLLKLRNLEPFARAAG